MSNGKVPSIGGVLRPRARRVSQARSPRPIAERRKCAPAEPGFIDAVRDQNGGLWIRYGTQQHAIWFAVADLIRNAPTVFSRLSSIGVSCITASSQTAFKGLVETQTESREALVASQPGWLEGFYVFGDGTVAAPNLDKREVIVTFEPRRKFAPQGTLEEWQATVGPFVTEQPLQYFVVALAFVGPLLRLVPAGYLSPQVEIVGPSETGKTTVATLGASVWSGNPDSDSGGGSNWDITLNAIDDEKSFHRDGLLVLDEGNLFGSSERERAEFALQAVFKVATTGGKRRMGDAREPEHARLALLSTSNTALADVINGTTEVRDAAHSRMITIRIEADAPHGVFTCLPCDYVDGRTASEALAHAINGCWGVAGRAFVERLVLEIERDELRMKTLVARALSNYMRLDTSKPRSARVQKSHALAAVAAAIAQHWGVLPKTWGLPMRMVQAIARSGQRGRATTTRDPLAEVMAYVEQHRSAIQKVDELVVREELGLGSLLDGIVVG